MRLPRSSVSLVRRASTCSPAYRPLKGKISIVTGASRGLGAAIAQNLASKGSNLVLNYTSDSSTRSTTSLVEELQEKDGIRAIPIQADLSSIDGPSAIISAAAKHFSTPESPLLIDIVINNAGYVVPQHLGEITPHDIQAQLRTNVQGPLLLVQAAMPHLPLDRSGRIVSVSSIGSSIGFWVQSVYAASKAGLEGMTRVWARELAERATANCVAPGAIDTGMYRDLPWEVVQRLRPIDQLTPLARVRDGVDGQEMREQAAKLGGRSTYPEEVVDVVGLLTLPEAGWITAVLSVRMVGRCSLSRRCGSMDRSLLN